MGTRVTQVLMNAFSNYLRIMVMMVVFFFLTPFILHKVGSEDFGLWSLIFSVIGILGLIDFGFETSVVKFVGECKGANDIERRNKILSTVQMVYLALAFVAAAGLGLFSMSFNKVFAIPAVEHGKAIILLWILAARTIGLSLPLGLYRGILFGDQKIYLINWMQIVFTLLYGVASWAVLQAGRGIVALAWVNLISMAGEYLAYYFLAFRHVKHLRISWKLADSGHLKEAVCFGASQFVVNVAALILLRTDPIIIKLFLPLSAVAVYAIALRVSEYLFLLTKQGVNVLVPYVAELKGAGDHEAIRRVLIKGTKYSFAPAAMLAVVVGVYAKEGIVLWMGREFETAAPVLVILVLALTSSLAQMTASGVLAMTGLHGFTAYAAFVRSVLNVTISVALVRPLGLNGVALATLISSFAVDGFMVIRKACKTYSLGFFEFCRLTFLPSALPGIVQFIFLAGMKTWFPPTELGAIVVVSFLSVLIYTFAFVAFSVEPAKKQDLIDHITAWCGLIPAMILKKRIQ